MRLSVGSTLGPYEISGSIGAGGMGEVYRAIDSRLGREVALKILPHAVSGDPERLARFEREARSSSALNHPNIVTVHDFALGDGETYLVMELVRGESLREALARGALPLRRLLPIATGVAEGLSAAHAAGIVHRDLKPENVMLTADGAPKIVDFGLVKSSVVPVSQTDSPTELEVSSAGPVLGTAAYMSPEQARGDAIDFRSDQFSFGLMLYEMATGVHPFRRATQYETLAAIANDEPELLGASFPEPFAWIVERCLARDPRERYGSTADLARDLVRLRDRSRSGALQPMVARAAPTRRLWAVAAAAAIAVFAILAAVIWTRGDRPDAGTPLSVAIATPEIPFVHFGEVALPVVLSPDGRHLAVYGRAVDGTNDLWLHDLRAATTKLLAQNAFAAGWSSDSRAIAYFADGKLKAIDIAGGPPRVICDARPEGTPTWHSDTILFTQFSSGRGLYRVAAAGGTPQRLVSSDTSTVRVPWSPHFLPDGKRFLYTSVIQSEQSGEITRMLLAASIDGSGPTEIAPVDSRVEFANGHLLFVRDGTLLAQPFDADALQFTGDAKPLLDGLHYFRSTGLAAFSASRNGLLAWRTVRPVARLVWLDRSGLEVGSVGRARLDGSGRLSPDGKRYAVGVIDPKQGVADIWTYDLVRESQERLTITGNDEKSPVWSPQGTLYYRTDGLAGPPDIARWTSDGSRLAVYRGPGVDEPHDVSPDGRSMLFVSYNEKTGADISVLPLDPPGQPRSFAATPFHETSPRYAPDGRRIAYSSNVSGRPEVYVRALEGSSPPVLISRSGGTSPRWSTDGSELFFLASGGRLMVASMGREAGLPRVLFQAPDAIDFEVASDGTRFLIQLIEGAREPPLRLLTNWPGRLN